MLKDFISAEKGLLLFSQQLLDDFKKEFESISQYSEDSKINDNKTKKKFENFDQKANQLFNILSTVLKSMKEMSSSITRNMN